MYGAGGKRVKLVGLGGISECSQSAVSRGSGSAGIGPLCLVFVSLSYIPASILLVAVPQCHQCASWQPHPCSGAGGDLACTPGGTRLREKKGGAGKEGEMTASLQLASPASQARNSSLPAPSPGCPLWCEGPGSGFTDRAVITSGSWGPRAVTS